VTAGRLARLAASDLGDHRVRTLVTISGVAVAIATFTLISQLSVSASSGVVRTVTRVTGQGATLEAEITSAATGDPVIADVARTVADDAVRDGAQSASRVLEAARVTLVANRGATRPGVQAASADGTPTMVYGVDRALADIVRVRLIAGRWFTEADGTSASVPLVLQRSLAARLASASGVEIGELVGSSVWVHRPIVFAFSIVGVMATNAFDRYAGTGAGALAPVSALPRLPSAIRAPLDHASVLVLVPPDDAETFARRVGALADDSLSLRGEPGVRVSVQRVDGAADFAAATTALVALLLGIAVITLGAGVLGVLNVMLMGVRERVAEFGLLRALGARPSDVFFTVLLESTQLMAAGGIIGVAIAVLAAPPVAAFLSGSLHGIPVRPISPAAAALGAAVSVAAGVLAGLLPARSAYRLSVLEAIRR
jgi:putative ABC transport system permease protein